MGEVRIPIEERVRVNRLPYKLPKKLTELLDGFKWAIHNKKQSAVMLVDGRSGYGKTTISFQCAAYMTPDFSLDNVYFTPESFIEALSNTKKGDTIIFDEAMLLSSRAALTAINRMMVVAMSMIRSKNLFIIFNVNSIFDIDRNLALSRADLLLNCYGDSLTDRGRFLAFFKGGDGQDRIKHLYIYGKKYYSYARPRSNFNATFSSYFVLDEIEYETKKQIGVNNFLKGKKTEAGKRWLHQRDKLIKYIYENDGLIQEDIGNLINVEKSVISDILAKFREEKPADSQGIATVEAPQSID